MENSARNICLDSGAEKVAIPSVTFLLTAQSPTFLGHDKRFVTSDSVSRKLLYEGGRGGGNLQCLSSCGDPISSLRGWGWGGGGIRRLQF